MLTKGLSKGANVGTWILNQAQKEWQNVIDNPIEGGGGMTAAGPVIGQLLQLIAQSGTGQSGVMPGKGQSQAGAQAEGGVSVPAQGIGPAAGQYATELVRKEREKAAKQLVKKQTQAEEEAGATPEQIIMGDFGQGVRGAPIQPARQVTATDPNAIMTSAGPGVKGAPIQPAQAPVAPQAEVPQQDNNKMKKIIDVIGAMAASISGGPAGLQNYEDAKTIRQQREVGMTASDTQKQMLGLQKELAKVESPKALTPESAARFQALQEGYNAVNNVSNVLLSDINKTTGLVVENKITPAFFKSQIARQLEASIESMVQAKTRAETGMGMAATEIKNATKRYAPRIGDSPETIRKRLKPLSDFFSGAINIADPTGVHRSRVSGGESRAELEAEAKRRGLI